MGARIEEIAKMPARVRKHIRIGHAEAIEPQRARLAGQRGLQIGVSELDGCIQKSRST
jgi:hypothetical protein